jgi:hypothetical protein
VISLKAVQLWPPYAAGKKKCGGDGVLPTDTSAFRPTNIVYSYSFALKFSPPSLQRAGSSSLQPAAYIQIPMR